ncbi:polysaccharide biosynthesis/export family protein [Methylobacterium sp. J-026]|uniref:polysaccharide biosynthesis/export family protein n=1 Tax=Methylobacterium sp. J-026 TaxID=2836624 RepID=UPI001FB915F8|nr:polysaccharide biosynthesis/export family protein [Methylobacterium sp. J-026]MCJ2133758.1 polysaccharide biosynthesis/export family protein [Methylobacterium sp. J-026]
MNKHTGCMEGSIKRNVHARRNFFAAASSLLIALMVMLPQSSHALDGDYRLGAGDKTRVRASEWRASQAQVYEWDAISGEYTINSSGFMSLPLIGDVKAAGKSTSEVADIIADGLVKKIGTVKRPEIAIEITQYRPFYILGPVTRPGDYPFRPNLTVLQAVGVAGGFRRTSDERPERESISSEGDLNVLQLTLSSYLTRLARLNAELSDAKDVTFPPEVNAQASNPIVRDFIKQQVNIFQSRKESMRSQLKSYEALKVLLNQEVTSLNERSQSQQRQIDLAKRERDAVDTLMNKGLTVNARQSTLEQQLAQFESSKLDISTSILRAQQELSKADRDSLELRNKFKNEVSDEIHDVSLKMQETKEKITTAQALLSDTDGYISKSSDRNARTSYTIVRKVDGKVQELAADEGTAVFPEDVVRVRINRKVDAEGGRTELGSEQAAGQLPGSQLKSIR